MYPVHLNPKVKKPVNDLLKNIKNIYLLEPLDYVSFVYLMSASSFIITDSGGIQEEAPSLEKPVILMRDDTERPEAVINGDVVLTGTDLAKIVKAADNLLINGNITMTPNVSKNPYGDGKLQKE